MVRQWYIIQFLERNEPTSHEKTWRKRKCILLSERSKIRKGDILYDSNYMTFWKRQNYGDGKKIRDCQGLGMGEAKEMNRQSTEDF